MADHRTQASAHLAQAAAYEARELAASSEALIGIGYALLALLSQRDEMAREVVAVLKEARNGRGGDDE